jgi:biotin transporter BioY
VITVEKKAFSVVLIYLALATVGFSVLAGGTSNATWFLAPSAGYYFGFLISSFFLIRIVNRLKPHDFLKTWVCLSFNESVILFCGYVTITFNFAPLLSYFVLKSLLTLVSTFIRPHHTAIKLRRFCNCSTQSVPKLRFFN